MKERLRYLLDKEQACGLDKAERWELSGLIREGDKNE